MDSEISALPLLTTKLYRPPVTPELEQRTRLIERLELRRQRPLTLISAPAGYGKTMLASMWLQTCGCPSGWVSLDENDNDLHTFVSYLLAALRQAFPSIKLTTRSLLESPTIPSVPVLARFLLNDLDQSRSPSCWHWMTSSAFRSRQSMNCWTSCCATHRKLCTWC
jgi:LuxR family maltose regulon positive regulatory protein